MKISTDYNIALNFFPITSTNFEFNIFKRVYLGPDDERPDQECKNWKLPLVSNESEDSQREYSEFWVAFEPIENFESFICNPGDNLYLTLAYLEYKLIEASSNNLSSDEYSIEEGFYRRVSYILQNHPEGEEIVWLEPYLLRRTGEFGFLADFRFVTTPGVAFSSRIQQLSLSLNSQGRENKNFYVDRFKKLSYFVEHYFHKIFPLKISESSLLEVDMKLRQLPADHLDLKIYVTGGESKSKSQFMGIKNHGPLSEVEDEVLLYFVYRPEDKQFSYDLFRALRGDTYRTFPGMEEFFGYTLGSEHVGGVAIKDFREKELSQVIQKIKEASHEKTVVPVVLIPWDKKEANERQSYLYYWMKHQFLSNTLPTQFVSLPTLKDREKLKWSVSNIALGIFAKMGGIPWKVNPREELCLIIGIGQSHLKTDNRIERYFAYSVLTDSSGLYEDLEILGRSNEEDQYLYQFKNNLIQVLRNYAERFDRFAIHSTFLLRQEELHAIQEVLSEYNIEVDSEKELVAMKFNDRNKFFGYVPTHNSLVPYESSFLKLSEIDYLIWFEGLQYGKSNVQRRIGRPMHVNFFYPKDELSEKVKHDYLQDALNLSGANWRGFNAKSSPVSIYYAYQIARYFREFSKHGFEEIDLTTLTPWFL